MSSPPKKRKEVGEWLGMGGVRGRGMEGRDEKGWRERERDTQSANDFSLVKLTWNF